LCPENENQEKSALARVGGKRPGAGRPPGSRNKNSAAIAQAALAQGKSPLEFALTVMFDEKQDMRIRMDACKAVLPHMHPRLNAIEHTGEGGGPLKVVLNGTDADL
jgi:hypothetical protein